MSTVLRETMAEKFSDTTNNVDHDNYDQAGRTYCPTYMIYGVYWTTYMTYRIYRTCLLYTSDAADE